MCCVIINYVVFSLHCLSAIGWIQFDCLRQEVWNGFIWINPFQANIPFLCPLKTSENLRFSDVFSRYRKGKLVWNGLISIKRTKRRCFIKKVFLKVLQDLQGNTCAGVSISIKLQDTGLCNFKRGSGAGLFQWILRNFYKTPLSITSGRLVLKNTLKTSSAAKQTLIKMRDHNLVLSKIVSPWFHVKLFTFDSVVMIGISSFCVMFIESTVTFL